MPPSEADLNQLKERIRGTWTAGDFGRIAQYAQHGSDEFVARLRIASGMQVLDVACGTGNLSIPAAKAGAYVTGIDIAPNLLHQARLRASEENLKIIFQEADAEQLPFPDASFDLVMSMFGAMFAPRPERAAAELARVCRPGGVVAMGNWTPQGFAGKTFSLTERYLPLPPGMLAPVLWGEENIVRERLGPYASKIETVHRELTFDYPFPTREVVQFFRDNFGPTKMAFARLDPAKQAAFAADLEGLWNDNNEATDAGRTLVHNEYLEVTATRA